MDQTELISVMQIGGLVFYKYPYLEIGVATVPMRAIDDFWKIWTEFIKDQQSAADVLQVLIDRGRKTGLELYVMVENFQLLPAHRRLSTAILSLENTGKIYHTPASVSAYTPSKLFQLFEHQV